jgi:pimeloyl-ACP methyl ester carboxylesterase
MNHGKGGAETRKEPQPPAAQRPEPGAYPELHAARRPRSDGRPAENLVFLHGGNVGNWVWDAQVKAFADYRIFTPHLPGFGARVGEDWSGMDSAADDVAAFVAEELEEGGVHLVGISLGGAVALRVMARHPELVKTAMVSGVAARGIDRATQGLAQMQIRLWGKEWFWRFQAGAFGLPPDERRLITDHGLSIRASNGRAISAEVTEGGVPETLDDYHGPALIVAGAKEPPVIRRSFPLLAAPLPQAVFRVAPGLHHQWGIEDPLLFNAVVRAWIETGRVHPRLQELPLP